MYKALIDRIADKDKPIYIGRVLELIENKNNTICCTGDFLFDGLSNTLIKEKYKISPIIKKLLYLWGCAGISKSLQEIAEESGYETYYDWLEVVSKGVVHEVKQLKNPEARDLFAFLESIL